MKTPILLISEKKQVKTRIFRPSEISEIRKQMKITDKTNFDMCLLLGARYLECQRIQNNPKWYDGNFIYLKEHKVKREHSQRYIKLSARGKNTIDYFFANEKYLPSVQAWDVKLKLWASNAGLTSEGVTARSLRKTWESWLVSCYPEKQVFIFLSQGHNEMIAIKHYLNLPFTSEEKKEMQEWVGGWE